MSLEWVLSEAFIIVRSCGFTAYEKWYDGLDNEVMAELHIGIVTVISGYAGQHHEFDDLVTIDVDNMKQSIYDTIEFVISVGEEEQPNMTTDNRSFLNWLTPKLTATTTAET